MKKKIIITLIVVAALVTGGVFAYQKIIEPKMAYDLAKDQLEIGNYEDAKAIFCIQRR